MTGDWENEGERAPPACRLFVLGAAPIDAAARGDLDVLRAAAADDVRGAVDKHGCTALQVVDKQPRRSSLHHGELRPCAHVDRREGHHRHNRAHSTKYARCAGHLG